MKYFSKQSRLQRRLRSLQILRAGKLSKQAALASTLKDVRNIPLNYLDLNLSLVGALGELDEEIRLIQEDLARQFEK